MIAKQKAADIVDKYIQILPYHSKESNLKKAKACALIAVDEILNTIEFSSQADELSKTTYWQKVKQEIINL